MENHEAPVSRAEQQQQHVGIELPEVSNSSPKPRRFICNSICSFAKEEYNKSDSEQRSKSTKKICVLIAFYALVMGLEIAGGVKANSLAVMTDAAHLLTDIAGFFLSLVAIWASGWKATSRQSFGFNRLEVLGALLSVQLIWLVSGILIYEAIDRMLHEKEEVDGNVMFGIATLGFLINFIMVVWLGHDHSHHGHAHDHDDHHDHHHNHHGLRVGSHSRNEEESSNLVSELSEEKTRATININLQGAFLHVMTDMIQSAGVMIAGAVIWVEPKWLVVDLLCTLIFSVLALAATLPMLKNVLYILMERTPAEIDVCRLENAVKYMDGVDDVHDLHVWAITNGKYVMACHVKTEPGVDSNELLHKVREYCETACGIHHVTVQIELV